MHMFAAASKKMGMGHAVMTGVTDDVGGADKAKAKPPTAAELASLLKHGAYDIFNEAEGADKAQEFAEDDIDSILSRATVVNHDNGVSGATGGALSKASFVAKAEKDDVDLDDPEFWSKVVGTGPTEDAKPAVLKERSARFGAKSYKPSYRKGNESGSDSDGEGGRLPPNHRSRTLPPLEDDGVFSEDEEGAFSDDDSDSLRADQYEWLPLHVKRLRAYLTQWGYVERGRCCCCPYYSLTHSPRLSL